MTRFTDVVVIFYVAFGIANIAASPPPTIWMVNEYDSLTLQCSTDGYDVEWYRKSFKEDITAFRSLRSNATRVESLFDNSISQLTLSNISSTHDSGIYVCRYNPSLMDYLNNWINTLRMFFARRYHNNSSRETTAELKRDFDIESFKVYVVINNSLRCTDLVMKGWTRYHCVINIFYDRIAFRNENRTIILNNTAITWTKSDDTWRVLKEKMPKANRYSLPYLSMTYQLYCYNSRTMSNEIIDDDDINHCSTNNCMWFETYVSNNVSKCSNCTFYMNTLNTSSTPLTYSMKINTKSVQKPRTSLNAVDISNADRQAAATTNRKSNVTIGIVVSVAVLTTVSVIVYLVIGYRRMIRSNEYRTLY